jgi:hypothetical protein
MAAVDPIVRPSGSLKWFVNTWYGFGWANNADAAKMAPSVKLTQALSVITTSSKAVTGFP